MFFPIPLLVTRDKNLGQKNVRFAYGGDKNRKNLRSKQICIYMENVGGPVSLAHLSKVFGKKESTMRKALQRLPCVKRVDTKMFVHVGSECRNGIGQIKRGVVTQNVRKFVPSGDNIPFDFPPELESFFEDTFLTETHGHEFLSPSNWTVIDPSIEIEETREWKYCNAFFQIRGGRVHVQSRPKYKGHKYGLDSKRFLEYLEWIRSQLLDLVGSVPAIDLVRCDINQDRPISYDGPPIRVEVLEGILALQVYVVERDDWYWELANNRLVRFEVINYGKPALDMAGKIQELLSRKAQDIRSMESVQRLFETTRRVLKYNLQEMGSRLRDFREVINKQGIAIEQNNELSKATAGLVLDMHSKIGSLQESLSTNLEMTNRILSSVHRHEGYLEQLALVYSVNVENNEVQTQILSRLESTLRNVVSILENLSQGVQVLLDWKDLSRQERLLLYDLALQNNISLRELARNLGTTHSAIIHYSRRNLERGLREIQSRDQDNVQSVHQENSSRFEVLQDRIVTSLQQGSKTKSELRRIAKCSYPELLSVLSFLEEKGLIRSEIDRRYSRGRNPVKYFLVET